MLHTEKFDWGAWAYEDSYLLGNNAGLYYPTTIEQLFLHFFLQWLGYIILALWLLYLISLLATTVSLVTYLSHYLTPTHPFMYLVILIAVMA